MDKKRGVGVSGKSTLDHMTKGREYLKLPFLFTPARVGQNGSKFGPRSC